MQYNTVMIHPTYTVETKLLEFYPFITGVDEVGRGSLAGPVVAAAVILDPNRIGMYRTKTKWWAAVRDSKTLSPIKRLALSEFIRENAIDFAIGQASNQEVDELNIHHATLLSMKRALQNLKLEPQIVLIDGIFKIPYSKFNIQTIVDGDAHVLSIAAASILAKVYRDDLMQKFSYGFSNYGFERHKGYDTDFHRNKLLAHGPCEIHRMSFSTVRDAMNIRFLHILSS